MDCSRSARKGPNRGFPIIGEDVFFTSPDNEASQFWGYPSPCLSSAGSDYNTSDQPSPATLGNDYMDPVHVSLFPILPGGIINDKPLSSAQWCQYNDHDAEGEPMEVDTTPRGQPADPFISDNEVYSPDVIIDYRPRRQSFCRPPGNGKIKKTESVRRKSRKSAKEAAEKQKILTEADYNLYIVVISQEDARKNRDEKLQRQRHRERMDWADFGVSHRKNKATRDPKSKPREQNLFCESCSFRTADHRDLTIHLNEFHHLKIHICGLCNAKFGRDDAFLPHIRDCAKHEHHRRALVAAKLRFLLNEGDTLPHGSEYIREFLRILEKSNGQPRASIPFYFDTLYKTSDSIEYELEQIIPIAKHAVLAFNSKTTFDALSSVF